LSNWRGRLRRRKLQPTPEDMSRSELERGNVLPYPGWSSETLMVLHDRNVLYQKKTGGRFPIGGRVCQVEKHPKMLGGKRGGITKAGIKNRDVGSENRGEKKRGGFIAVTIDGGKFVVTNISVNHNS